MAAHPETSGNAFLLSFDTKGHSISARALADNLTALTNAIERANPEGKPYEDIVLNATAVQPGSFEVWLEIAVVGLALVGPDKISLIIQDVSNFLNIRKLLGEKKPIITENPDNSVNITVEGGITFNNCSFGTKALLEDKVVAKSYSRAMGSLKTTDFVEGFSLANSSREELARVDKSEFVAFQKVKPESEHPDIKEVVEAELYLRKVVLSGKDKWGFVYNGISISAKIDDSSFNEAIDSGSTRFGSGDRILVNLEIHKKYDKQSDSYMIRSYKILNVIRHISRLD